MSYGKSEQKETCQIIDVKAINTSMIWEVFALCRKYQEILKDLHGISMYKGI